MAYLYLLVFLLDFEYISDEKMFDWCQCDSSISHLHPEGAKNTSSQTNFATVADIIYQTRAWHHLLATCPSEPVPTYIMHSANIDGVKWQPKGRKHWVIKPWS